MHAPPQVISAVPSCCVHEKEEKAKCMRRTDGGAVKSPGENLKRLGLGLGLGVQLQPAVQAMR